MNLVRTPLHDYGEGVYEAFMLATDDGRSATCYGRRYRQQFWVVTSDHVRVCESHPGFHRSPDGAERCVERYWKAQNADSATEQA